MPSLNKILKNLIVLVLIALPHALYKKEPIMKRDEKPPGQYITTWKEQVLFSTITRKAFKSYKKK
jgi:hypothetical protein